MSDPAEPKFPPLMSNYLTTEHFTLQGARSIINGEIASRASMYFTTLSSIIVATAFVVQIPNLNNTFLTIGAIAFPLVILLGFFTTSRLAVLGSMDATYIKAINRIRHFYYQSTPEIQPFLLFPPFDDDKSIGIYGGWGKQTIKDNLLSAANTIVTTNSIVMTVYLNVIIFGLDDFSIFWMFVIFILSYGLHMFITWVFVKNWILQNIYRESLFPYNEKHE